jgi:hypothetical protein
MFIKKKIEYSKDIAKTLTKIEFELAIMGRALNDESNHLFT